MLRACSLSKSYNTSSVPVFEMFNVLARKSIFKINCISILKDINFNANKGEVVGIIGNNGAGKSTLLRIVCGNLLPTSGQIIKNGSISAILELGMGFHPDFTGRKNAIMEAQINSVESSCPQSLIAKIEKFADIGDYFDKPIKTYSSGMIARLAFAVASASEPDILIVDEALSVGDIAFQAKCMQRMRYLKDKGTCILFVSHSLNLIREFCNKVLYLENGSQKAFGQVDTVCDQYQNDLTSNQNYLKQRSHSVEEIPPQQTPNPNLRKFSIREDCGTLDLEFLDFQIMNSCSSTVDVISYNDKVIIRADILANKNVSAGTAVGLLIADKVGYHLISCNSNLYDKNLPSLAKGQRISMLWEFHWPFQSGEFRIDIGLKPNPFDNHFYDRVFCVKTIQSFPDKRLIDRNFGGYLFLDATVKTTEVYN